MIKTAADFLTQLVEQEKIEINKQGIKHAPTIGEMYEGLTSDILNRITPPSLDLKIVSGFIENELGEQSKQIDCMLVRGTGEQLPHTNKYKWNIHDVICVVEVKKNLLKDDLMESYENLNSLTNLLENSLQNMSESNTRSFLIKDIQIAFEKITGISSPNFQTLDRYSFEYQQLFHSLVLDYIMPIRIAIGYEGYKTEKGLRSGFQTYLNKCTGLKGYGPVNFPSLITSDKFSLLKATGHPFVGPWRKDRWYFYNSTRANPLHLILELVWTKLEQLYPVGGFWDDASEDETFSPFLAVKPIEQNDIMGWGYYFTELSEDDLKEKGETENWSPNFINDIQASTLYKLTSNGFVDINDLGFREICEKNNLAINEVVDPLVETRLVILDGTKLITRCESLVIGICPKRGYYFTDDPDKVSGWLSQNI